MTNIQNRFSTYLTNPQSIPTQNSNISNEKIEKMKERHGEKQNGERKKHDPKFVPKEGKDKKRNLNKRSNAYKQNSSLIDSFFPIIEPLGSFQPSILDLIYNAETIRNKPSKETTQQKNEAFHRNNTNSQIQKAIYPKLNIDSGMDEIAQVRFLIQKFEAYLPSIDVKQPALKPRLLQALTFLVQALQLLRGQEYLYGNIIVDITQRIWNSCRRIAREGARQWAIQIWGETLTSLEKAIQECGASQFLKEWSLQCGIQYILALDDAKQTDQAIKEMGRLNDIVSGKTTGKAKGTDTKSSPIQQSILDNLFRLQLHLGRNGKKGGNAPKDSNQKYLQSIQTAKSLMFDDATKMEKELQDVLNMIKKELGCEGDPSEQKKALRLKTPPEDKLNILSELAFIASHNNWTQIANDALLIASASKSMHTIILCDYSRALLLMNSLPTNKKDKLTSEMMQTRMKSISLVEKGVLNSKNLDPQFSGDVLLQGCFLLWNFCLPLLNENLIKQIRGPLSQIINALEEYDVHHINEFRAKVLLELANCNMVDDILTKASTNIREALTLDYIVKESEIELFGLLRTLDRYLIPRKDHLDLKLDVYKTPEKSEEEAYLLLEQAKDASDLNLKKQLLENAFSLLQKSLKENNTKIEQFSNENAIDKGFINQESLQLYQLKNKFSLLCRCAKLAWSGNHKIVSLVQEVCKVIINPDSWNNQKWIIERDLDVFVDLALVNLIMAESFIVQLQQEGLELHTICDEEDKEYEQLILNAESSIQEHIKIALKIGVESKQLWIVENCCIYLWNYHLPQFQDRKEFYPLLETLSQAFSSLIQFTDSAYPGDKSKSKDTKNLNTGKIVENVDPNVLSRISYAYVCALIEKFSIEKKGKDIDYIEHYDTIYTLSHPSNSNHESLKKALEIIDLSLPKISETMLAKELIFFRSKVLKLMTDKSPSVLTLKDASLSEKLLSFIEVLRQSIAETEKQKLIEEVTSIVLATNESIHPEIYFWLSYYFMQSMQYRQASQIVEKCVESVSLETNYSQLTTSLTPRMWRWISLSILIQAHCLLEFIDPKSQNLLTQINLRKQALEKLVTSMKCSSNAADLRIGTLICKEAVSCIKGLISQSNLRKNIAETLYQLIINSQYVKTDSAYVYLEQLYLFTFRCLRENSSFDKGVILVKKALTHLPPSLHKNIWKFDVEFRSRSGSSDVRSSINRVSGYSVEMQANVLSLVGRYSNDLQLQRECYQKAINILAEQPTTQVQFMVQYAIWMYIHELPQQDVVDILMNCVDILNRFDQIELDLNDSSEVGSVISSRSAFSKKSSVSSLRSLKSKQSAISSRKSVRSSKISNITEKQSEELRPINISQLDSLAMIFTLLSITSQTSEERFDYAITAHFYLLRILKTGFDYANSFLLKKGELKSRYNKEESAPTIKIFQFPTILDNWIDYEISEEIIEIWNQKFEPPEENLSTKPTTEFKIQTELNEFVRKNRSYAIHSDNLLNSQQSFFLLDELFEFLLSEGYYAHCIPLLQLKKILGNQLDYQDTFKSLLSLQLSHIMGKLSLKERRDEFRKQAGDYVIHPTILKQQQEIHNVLLSEMKENNQQSKSILNYREHKLSAFELRHLWKEQARFLIENFELSSALHLLEHSQKDSIAHDDMITYSQCCLLLSKIFFLQGNFQQAIKLSSNARSRIECDIKFLSDCLIITLKSLLQSREIRIAEALFKESMKIFTNLETQNPTNSFVILSVAEFQYSAANILISNSNYEKQCIQWIKQSLEKIKKYNSNSTLYSQMSLNYAKFLLDRAFTIHEDDHVFTQTNFSIIESSLQEIISILESNKILLQNIVTEIIPPGSHLSDRYPCSQLLSENLILLGRSLSMLQQVQNQIYINNLALQKLELAENLVIPRLDTQSNEKRESLYEATKKFMIQSIVEDFPTFSTSHLEKSIAMFSTSYNLTSSSLLQCESDLLIAQCLRMLHIEKIDQQLPIILSHLEKSFIEAFNTENWNILALASLELSEVVSDQKLAAKYLALSQSAFNSINLLKQYKEQALSNVSEIAFIRLYETMKSELIIPFENEIFKKVYNKLKSQSPIFSTLSPSSILHKQGSISSSKDIVENITKSWPSSDVDSFVNVNIILSPPPPANISNIKRYLYASIVINDTPTVDSKKSAAKTTKGKVEEVDQTPDPIKFVSKLEIKPENIEQIILDYKFWQQSLNSRDININNLNLEFQKIVENANNQFFGLFESLKETLQFYSKKGNSKLILTVDPTLQSLPWEAMFITSQFSSFSRDLSSLFISTRIANGSTSTLNANWNNITFSIDPFNIESPNEFNNLKNELLAKKCILTGIFGNDYSTRSESPHLSEIQQLLNQAALIGSKQDGTKKKDNEPATTSKGVFLYIGPNILDWIKSENIASLRLQGLNTMLLFDKQEESDYVNSIDASTLLSLRGISTIVQNQYRTLNLNSEIFNPEETIDPQVKSIVENINQKLPYYIIRQMQLPQKQDIGLTLQLLRKQFNNHFVVSNTIIFGLP